MFRQDQLESHFSTVRRLIGSNRSAERVLLLERALATANLYTQFRHLKFFNILNSAASHAIESTKHKVSNLTVQRDNPIIFTQDDEQSFYYIIGYLVYELLRHKPKGWPFCVPCERLLTWKPDIEELNETNPPWLLAKFQKNFGHLQFPSLILFNYIVSIARSFNKIFNLLRESPNLILILKMRFYMIRWLFLQNPQFQIAKIQLDHMIFVMNRDGKNK